MGLKTFHGYLKQIDGMLAGREWLSDRYSVLEPYGFVFYTWGVRRELPMAELKNYTALKDRMLQRPAVQRVVEDEKIKVVGRGATPLPVPVPGTGFATRSTVRFTIFRLPWLGCPPVDASPSGVAESGRPKR